MTKVPGCPLCEASGGTLVFEASRFRVIRAHEEGFPAFWRLVWNDHAAEFSDLDRADRLLCTEALATIEAVVLRALSPTKMNLATLGNMVPHLHWHVIARFGWDSHFPAPVWASAQRAADPVRLTQLAAACPGIDAQIAAALAAMPTGA